MHMERGIGRAGYRLLALVFFAIGLGGLAAAWAAITVEFSTVFQYAGLGTAAFGMTLMFIMATAATFLREESWEDDLPAPVAAPAPAAPAAPAQPAPEPRAATIDVEFEDAEPAAKAIPDHLVLPKAFANEPVPGQAISEAPVAPQRAPLESELPDEPVRTPSGAPARPPTSIPAPPGDATHWPARGQSERRPRTWEMPVEEPANKAGPQARQEMRERYTKNTPLVRSLMEGAGVAEPKSQEPAAEVPVVRAELCPPDVDADWMPDGKTRGRCGNCQQVILAPDARPIRLRCPNCATEKLLQ